MWDLRLEQQLIPTAVVSHVDNLHGLFQRVEALYTDIDTHKVDYEKLAKEFLASLAIRSFVSDIRDPLRKDMQAKPRPSFNFETVVDTAKTDYRMAAAIEKDKTDAAPHPLAALLKVLQTDSRIQYYPRCRRPSWVPSQT